MKVRLFVAEVSRPGGVDEYQVVATDEIHARDLVTSHLAPLTPGQRIRVRSTPGEAEGDPRVIKSSEPGTS